MSFRIDGTDEFSEIDNNKPRALVEINMTPFVDVCLVLLIIFMVSAPFAVSGINVRIPKTSAKALSMSNDALILSVTKKGDFYLGKNKVLESELVEKIKLVAGGEEKAPIFIRADKEVPYEKVMIAMAASQNAGVERIGMIGENKRNKK